MLLPERKKSQKMYKFSSAGKAIARGDDMKKPNKLLNKKYISSLVIAAFLILSVLTAYNIQFGNNRQEEKDTSGKMPWPVMGNVILPYSMDTTVYYTTLDQYACNDGILIGAKKGEDVIATADGRIVNIAKSDRYGTTVTMVIGEYYEVSYSQVENVNYEIGDEVKEGDVIATVAEPTRSFTLEGPHLFFKMTYKGETVNPTDYLEA